MAHIISFSVEGLAGRTDTYSRDMQRDVNVFFGINGCGKTTLLKILHSALSTDPAILSGLPFKRADVKVYLNRHRSVFTRTFEQPETPPEQEEGQTAVTGRMILGGLAPNAKPEWKTNPEEPTGPRLTRYTEGYLPITRLYRAVGARSVGTRAMSDQELDARFAKEAQRIWSVYYAQVSFEVSEVQEKGLANILHFVLSGEEPPTEDDTVLDTKEAYERVSSFLGRQAGLADALDSCEEFEKKYKRTPQIKSIVKQIDFVERQIEEATSPRQRLKHLLESMYSGNKRITFSEKEISVEIENTGKIKLPSLSSGEKQLFLLSLIAVQAGDHTVIIDEPELSMHVDWQKKLITSLRELNPRMQLIMATHSPEIMADLPDDKVFSL